MKLDTDLENDKLLLLQRNLIMSSKNIIDPPGIVRSINALAEQINAAHAQTEMALHAGLEHARKAGGLLLQAKNQCGHGQWLAWLKRNVRFSARTARAYMSIASRWEELAKRQRVADLSYREGLRMLADPEPEPEEESDAESEGDQQTYLGNGTATSNRPPRPETNDETLEDEAIVGDAEEASPVELLDQNEQMIPPQAYEAFNQIPEIRELVLTLERFSREVQRVAALPVGRRMQLTTILSQIKTLKANIKHSKPAYVCPYCKGTKTECRACQGDGWVIALTYDAAPPEIKVQK